jgi:hypothetical protein
MIPIFFLRITDYIALENDKVELTYDSDANDSSGDEAEIELVNRDPTLSKYSLEQMGRMKEMRDKGWSFSTIKSKFTRLSNASELKKYGQSERISMTMSSILL